MGHFKNYIEFKEFNPYSEKDLDYEREVTPPYVDNTGNFTRRRDSKSSKIAKKYMSADKDSKMTLQTMRNENMETSDTKQQNTTSLPNLITYREDNQTHQTESATLRVSPSPLNALPILHV